MSKNIFISGFSTIRNGIKFGYPFIESIKSILPVVDEFVITVGKSEDGTLNAIKDLKNKKIRVIETLWDPRFTVKSRILAVQTNMALFQCTGTWAFYIQADEVFHENDRQKIMDLCRMYKDDNRIEGLLFDYKHFFGNYKWFADSYHWYRKEIRIIKNHRGIISWRDAQSFRADGKKINVIDSGARMFHYGWVRPPAVMAEKRKQHDRLHHGQDYHREAHDPDFNYLNEMDTSCMKLFQGEHPAIMKSRIKNYNIDFNPDMVKFKPGFKDYRRRIQNKIGKLTGYYPGEYRNYNLLKI